ncbi:MAG TPA: hypothetical protein VNZ45_09015 [Bacteroidia bacterium]|jgi:hypothetical protein|nr:hypothetical protein [Bacteroidia bacterium]
MRNFTFLILFLSGFNCLGQDTITKNSNYSISFSAGANIIYPVTGPYRYTTPGPNPFWGPYYDFEITPLTSASPYMSLTGNAILHNFKHVSFSLSAGISYMQYNYAFSLRGWDNNMPWEDSGLFKAREQFNVLEFNGGLAANIKLGYTISWYNEIELVFGVFNSTLPPMVTNAPGGLPFDLIIGFNWSGPDRTNGTYMYTFYKTGIGIKLSERLNIMPEISIPLYYMDYTIFQENTNENTPLPLGLPTLTTNSYQPSNIARSLRGAVTLTYTFNKKRNRKLS